MDRCVTATSSFGTRSLISLETWLCSDNALPDESLPIAPVTRCTPPWYPSSYATVRYGSSRLKIRRAKELRRQQRPSSAPTDLATPQPLCTCDHFLFTGGPRFHFRFVPGQRAAFRRSPLLDCLAASSLGRPQADRVPKSTRRDSPHPFQW